MTKRMASILIVMLAACGGGGDDGGDDSSGDDTSSGCTGDVTQCPLAELSSEQLGSFCDTLLAVVGDPPGTVYECEETGLFLGVNDRATCASAEFSSSCPLTGADLIDCYQAAQDDACAALSETGACADLFANAEACGS